MNSGQLLITEVVPMLGPNLYTRCFYHLAIRLALNLLGLNGLTIVQLNAIISGYS